MRASGQVLKVTIAAGQTASDIVDLMNTHVVGIQTPAALTGTALSFKGALTKGASTVVVTKSDGTTNTAVTMPMAANLLYAPVGALREALLGVRYLQLVSGTTEVAERVFLIVLGD